MVLLVEATWVSAVRGAQRDTCGRNTKATVSRRVMNCILGFEISEDYASEAGLAKFQTKGLVSDGKGACKPHPVIYRDSLLIGFSQHLQPTDVHSLKQPETQPDTMDRAAVQSVSGCCKH